MVKPKPKRARWYMQFIGECPVCGRDASHKEAMYTDPPPKEKRYKRIPDSISYDYCEGL